MDDRFEPRGNFDQEPDATRPRNVEFESEMPTIGSDDFEFIGEDLGDDDGGVEEI